MLNLRGSGLPNCVVQHYEDVEMSRKSRRQDGRGQQVSLLTKFTKRQSGGGVPARVLHRALK